MDNKKAKLKTKIDEIVNTVLDKAAADNNLNFFDIEIKVHQDNINVTYATKYKEKVY